MTTNSPPVSSQGDSGVKRYIWHEGKIPFEDGYLASDDGAGPQDQMQFVLASDYDALLADRDQMRAEMQYGWVEVCETPLKRVMEERDRLRDEVAQRGRWVPWKPGDALPAPGRYWATVKRYGSIYTHQLSAVYHGKGADWFALAAEENVIAYWSVPLPPPYDPSSGGGSTP